MATNDEQFPRKTSNQNSDANHQNYGDFSAPWNMSDLVLKVENENLHVHRCMLSLWSPVFNRMFTGDFREKDADVITLPGKNVKEIREMLEVIYDRRKKITGIEEDLMMKYPN